MILRLEGSSAVLFLRCSTCDRMVKLTSELPVAARVFIKGWFKADMIAPNEYELKQERGVTIDCGGCYDVENRIES